MPEWKKEIEARLAPLRIEPAREAEIVEELSQHLNDRYEELVARGSSEEAARRELLVRGLVSFGVLAASAFLLLTSQPRLGLDLRGGTQIVLEIGRAHV